MLSVLMNKWMLARHSTLCRQCEDVSFEEIIGAWLQMKGTKMTNATSKTVLTDHE